MLEKDQDISKIFKSRVSSTPIRTVSELENWMKRECANNSGGYGIGQPADNGFEIKKIDTVWHWQFTERGTARTIQTFASEQEAVSFAYHQIRNDPWAWTHCVGWFRAERDSVALTAKLRARGLSFYSDQIPYGGPSDPRYRIFVFGRDSLHIEKVDPAHRT